MRGRSVSRRPSTSILALSRPRNETLSSGARGYVLKGVDADALVAAHVCLLRAAIVIGVDRAALVAAFRRHAPDLWVVPVRIALARGRSRPDSDP